MYDGLALAMINSPAELVVIGDCYDYHAPATTIDLLLGYIYSEFADNPDLAGRHNNGNNFTFADGHAKWIGVTATRTMKWYYYN